MCYLCTLYADNLLHMLMVSSSALLISTETYTYTPLLHLQIHQDAHKYKQAVPHDICPCMCVWMCPQVWLAADTVCMCVSVVDTSPTGNIGSSCWFQNKWHLWHTHTHSLPPRVNTKHSHGNWWCNRHTHTLWCNRCNVGLRHMLALLQLRWWESRACHRQETCPGRLKMSKSRPSFYTIRKKQKPAMKSYSNRSITPLKAQHKTTIWDHGKYKIGMSFILIFSEASGLFAGLFNSIINWTKK